jgi:hypothetical protein
MNQKATIGHHIPGRLRMRVAHARNNPKLLDGIAKSLKSLSGVRDIDVSPATGSLLLHYNKNLYADFGKSLADAGEDSELFSLTQTVEEEAEIWASQSDLIRSVVEAVSALNEQLKGATGNQINLKVLAGLAATAIAFARRSEGTPLWVTLAIFTLHSHLELQREAQWTKFVNVQGSRPRRPA